MSAHPILPSDLITLKAAAAILPPKRTGKRVCVSTIRRWGITGRIRLYDCNGLKVSETELRSRFKVRVVRPEGLVDLPTPNRP